MKITSAAAVGSHGATLRARGLRKRAVALALSLVLHAVALVAMFGAAEGGVVSSRAGGGFEEAAISVSLVGPAGSPKDQAGEPAAGLSPLFAKFRIVTEPDNAVFATTKTSDLAGLADRLTRRDAPVGAAQKRILNAREAAQERAPNPTTDDGREAKSPGPLSDRPREGDAVDASSSGSLWGRIEPCWRRTALTSRVPVTLEVTLDAQGGLKTPPTIVRKAAASIDEPRLRAEAAALTSLAACLPRGDPTFAGRHYRLEFLPPR